MSAFVPEAELDFAEWNVGYEQQRISPSVPMSR
jgi:hypothetical protein